MANVKAVIADIEKPIEFAEKAAKVIDSVISSQSEIKQVLSDLIVKSEALGSDITVDVADKGINLLLDAQTGTDLLNYVEWIRATLVPEVVKLYGVIAIDVKTPAAS